MNDSDYPPVGIDLEPPQGYYESPEHWVNTKPTSLEMKVYISADDIREALKELGPTGNLAEAYVKQAAMIAIHILEGGYVTRV